MRQTIEWRCETCGAEDKVSALDAWSALSESNKQHEILSPECDIKQAKIYPKGENKNEC